MEMRRSKNCRYKTIAADGFAIVPVAEARTVYEQPEKCMRCPNPVALPTGGVALFHSHWPEKYRFGAWLTDSEIALATAATADGPFVSHGVILKGAGEASAWDRDAVTDPCVLQHNGKWFLYYMGTHGDEPHPKLETPGWWVCRNNQRIGCAVADRPEGPWKRLGLSYCRRN